MENFICKVWFTNVKMEWYITNTLWKPKLEHKPTITWCYLKDLLKLPEQKSWCTTATNCGSLKGLFIKNYVKQSWGKTIFSYYPSSILVNMYASFILNFEVFFSVSSSNQTEIGGKQSSIGFMVLALTMSVI